MNIVDIVLMLLKEKYKTNTNELIEKMRNMHMENSDNYYHSLFDSSGDKSNNFDEVNSSNDENDSIYCNYRDIKVSSDSVGSRNLDNFLNQKFDSELNKTKNIKKHEIAKQTGENVKYFISFSTDESINNEWSEESFTSDNLLKIESDRSISICEYSKVEPKNQKQHHMKKKLLKATKE